MTPESVEFLVEFFLMRLAYLFHFYNQIKQLSGEITYEGPNKSLYTFAGKAKIGGEEAAVLNDYVLLRGSKLKNTAHVFGIVVYAGKFSKIQMNSKSATIKRSNVERMANHILGVIFAFELLMCSLGCIGNYIWASANSGVWYLPYVQDLKTVDTLLSWVTYFILLNNYIPISLYVSMEIAKLGQKILIDNDLDMYHPESDTPCQARTSNLNEELGQIQYIFSDKTGTLTRNEMEFRKCWIAGTSYGFGTTEIGEAAAKRGALQLSENEDEARKDANSDKAQYNRDPKLSFDDVRLRHRYETNHKDAPFIRDFLRVLSVAHTVVPEAEDEKKPTAATVKYQAESPDESALVGAAKALGFFFYNKVAAMNSLKYYINVFEKTEEYEILNINQFNSTRKRMSAVVRTPAGTIELYIKGADNVMFDRLAKGQDREGIKEALRKYGNEGLRTLIIAKRQIGAAEHAAWNERFQNAFKAIQNREQQLMDAAEEIEKDLEILGATAIEDKLQLGVPETIATLAKAGIRIWVLTGDKQETAENIGFACNLLNDDMDRVYLVEDNLIKGDLGKVLSESIDKYKSLVNPKDPLGPCEKLSLIVDGAALNEIMKAVEDDKCSASQKEIMLQFLAFAKMCKSVIACRVSPDQKRQIVAMVKLHSKPTPLTLSIGDGANDVPMILEASVGVGISGNEGMQAVRSSDYAIAQFAYLKRLLLVHGRSNYKRISVVVMYSLYKNSFLVSTLLLYGVWTGWTGTALFDSLMLAGFNVLWALAGIILFGSIENDVSPQAAIDYPQLYMTGAKKADFNSTVLLTWMARAFAHTALCLVVPVYCFQSRTVLPSGLDESLAGFGLCVMQALVIAVNMKLLLMTANLTRLSLLIYVGSAALFVGGAVVHSLWLFSSLFATEYYFFFNVAMTLYAAPATWLIQLLTVVVILIPDVVAAYLRRNFRPTAADVVREIDLGYGPPKPPSQG
jgi:phospholipid-transporting ATPase